MTNKKSICFLSPYALPALTRSSRSTGGAERQFVLFGRQLRKNGWEVSYIIEDSENGKVVDQVDWCKIHMANFRYLGGSNWHIFVGMFSLFKAMVLSNANIFVVKTQAFLLLPMGLLCLILRKRIIFWAQADRDFRLKREGIPKIHSWAQNQGMRLTSLFIAQGKEQALLLKSEFGYDSTVIPSISSTLSDTATIKDNKKNSFDNNNLVLWCGNSSINKRQEVFFEVAQMLPEISFVMAMGRVDESRYQHAVDKARTIPNLLFLGSVPSLEMEQWFLRVSLYVNTSIFEGFPNTYLQSWQAGVPIISLNVDPDKVLSNNALGVVLNNQTTNIQCDDYHALATHLATTISTLLNDPKEMCAMGQRAQIYVAENHDQDKVGFILETTLINLDA